MDAAVTVPGASPLVVAGAFRGPDGLHHLTILDVFLPEPQAGPAWIEEATRKSTQALEQFVHAGRI